MKNSTNAEKSVVFLPKSIRHTTGFADSDFRCGHNLKFDRLKGTSEFVASGPERIVHLSRPSKILFRRAGTLSAAILALSLAAVARAQDDAVTAVHATIQKVDSSTKTIVVKTDDGATHTVHFLDSTAVHGGDAADVAAKDSWHGLKQGGEVVVHYSEKGTVDTAVEVDKVGAGGLKTTEGTVKEIDRGGKSVVVVAGDGTEQTFRLTGEAAKDTGAGVGKGSKVTVFYLGKAGRKVAHFLGTTSSGPS